jgi:hypothetical protein
MPRPRPALLSFPLLPFLLLAAVTARAQVRPSHVYAIDPRGVVRGATSEVVIDGANLEGATAVLFDEAGLRGRILEVTDQGEDKPERATVDSLLILDRARKSRARVELTVPEGARQGRHGLRLVTPLGTTNIGLFDVGVLPEVREDAAAAGGLRLPVTVNGRIGKEDEVDAFAFDAREGESLVFKIDAGGLGSSLDARVTVVDAAGAEVATSDNAVGGMDPVFDHRFLKAGRYTVRVGDALNEGGKAYFYRLTVGVLPFVKAVFPLGVPAGAPSALVAEGENLGAPQGVPVKAEAQARGGSVPLPLETPQGRPLNLPRVAVGTDPELREHEPNDTLAAAQPLRAPTTVNGRIEKPGDADVFRFEAAQGQSLVFEVMARRLGSPLDSVIEVLDAKGAPVPRATLRPMLKTSITLRDHGSQDAGIRLESWAGISVGDLLLIGDELMEVAELPAGPDADVVMRSFRGERVPLEDTSGTGHPQASPVYKVERLPPGAKPPANGLPVFTVVYRNDDGGPFYRKDSRLTFAAPATGVYYVRVADARGLGGPLFAYRLTVAPPRPDFQLLADPANPNVPRGGRVPLKVASRRFDGFNGPIDVRVEGLPAGIRAEPGVIAPGRDSVTLILSAEPDTALETPAPYSVSGQARIAGRSVTRVAGPAEPSERGEIRVVALATPPDLRIVSAEPREITIAPGEKARVKVQIERGNGFAGRVGLTVQNLPMYVSLPDVGLNGILITEQQDGREFELVADPRAEPQQVTLYVTGRVECNSMLPTDHASLPIRLTVTPRRTATAR